MTVLSRVRTHLLACCVAAAPRSERSSSPRPPALPRSGSTYLALGDSLAYGYHQAQFLRS